jgi:transposase
MSNADWAIGFEDETWWSRFAMPNLHAWSESGQPLRLVEQSVAKKDPDPKAVACYGLLVESVHGDGRLLEEVWLRFVDGRPVSGLTTAFLEWSCSKLEGLGKRVLVLVWDNASWHISAQVRGWIGEHNRRVKAGGYGVRIISCLLPKKSPWLNRIEPRWIHGKRRVVEPDGLLTAQVLIERVCAHFGCRHEDHLTIPENVA